MSKYAAPAIKSRQIATDIIGDICGDMMESDKDFIADNHEFCLWALENATQLVRCVSIHEELLRALEFALPIVEGVKNTQDMRNAAVPISLRGNYVPFTSGQTAFDAITAILARAKESV